MGGFSSVVALQLNKLPDTRRLHKTVGTGGSVLKPCYYGTRIFGWYWSPRSQYLAWPWFVGYTAKSLKHTRSRICVREVGPDHLERWDCTREGCNQWILLTRLQYVGWKRLHGWSCHFNSCQGDTVWKLWPKLDCIHSGKIQATVAVRENVAKIKKTRISPAPEVIAP